MKLQFLSAIVISLLGFFGLSTTISAATATLQFNPQSQTITKGQIVTATILLTTDVKVNRILAKINYPNAILKPQSIDTSNSFVTLWYQNSIGSVQGQLILEGGVSANGISGNQLEFAKINFESIGTGAATVSFDNTSTVSQSSDGTNILSEFSSAAYTVIQITPTLTLTPTPVASPTPSTVPSVSINPSITGLPKGGSTDLTYYWVIASVITTGLGFFILKHA